MGASDLSSIGQPVRRKEDYRFLTGGGRFTDDVNEHRQTWAYFLRSAHAHARIRGIDSSKAKAAQGVVAIFTGDDLTGVNGLPFSATSIPAIPSRVSTISLVCEPCGVCLRRVNITFAPLMPEAVSRWTVRRTSSTGDSEGWSVQNAGVAPTTASTTMATASFGLR